MTTKPKLTVFVAVLALFTACGDSGHRELQGYLYFSAGSYLAKFDLGDRSSSVVANLGDVNIRHISGFDRDRLLLTIAGSHRGIPFSRVLRFDTQTNESFEMFSGNAAWFMPDSNFFVYDDDSALKSRGMRQHGPAEKVVARHRMNARLPVVILSQHELLYEIETADGPQIFWHDVLSGDGFLMPELTAICRLSGAVWISSRGMLFCQQRDSDTRRPVYVLASLDAEEVEEVPLPDARSLFAVTYLPGQDVVILTSAASTILSRSDQKGIWAHDLRDTSNYQLAGNQHLGDSVAWAAR